MDLDDFFGFLGRGYSSSPCRFAINGVFLGCAENAIRDVLQDYSGQFQRKDALYLIPDGRIAKNGGSSFFAGTIGLRIGDEKLRLPILCGFDDCNENPFNGYAIPFLGSLIFSTKFAVREGAGYVVSGYCSIEYHEVCLPEKMKGKFREGFARDLEEKLAENRQGVSPELHAAQRALDVAAELAAIAYHAMWNENFSRTRAN